MIGFGETFYKLSGSGNDFVAFDRMAAAVAALPTPEEVRALCAPGTGVGADGVVVLHRAPDVAYQLAYYNRDGSRAELCGNASLCSVRLAVELGLADPAGLRFLTDSGVLTGRIADGLPEIDLGEPTEVAERRPELIAGVAQGDERAVGFARVGVPHVVVACDDSSSVDLLARAPALRHHSSLRDGANVNFVSPTDDGWAIRTFERGVEAETLACGTGSVASAVLLAAWTRSGQVGAPGEPVGRLGSGVRFGDAIGDSAPTTVTLRTRSGLVHRVTLRERDSMTRPSLAGDARIVFRGELGEGAW